jgi:predicted murein hydrolase (TIGR00659 family)
MLLQSFLLIITTLSIYFTTAFIQQKYHLIWLNPILVSIFLVSPILIIYQIDYTEYFAATQWLNSLIELAVVALGYPLYKQVNQIKQQWKIIFLILSLGAVVAITTSLFLTLAIISLPEIAISLSLKSITTPIGIALTEQLGGNSSITAIAIIIAGLLGATLGHSWLKLIKIKSPLAQGLAIGAASHVIGSAAMTKISNIHTAYSSIALITSALLTSLISPWSIPTLLKILY